jgi:hypothetical protein
MRLKLIQYAKIDNFVIGAEINEMDEVVGYIVCDRNMERYSRECFESPALAIAWAHDNFRGVEA